MRRELEILSHLLHHLSTGCEWHMYLLVPAIDVLSKRTMPPLPRRLRVVYRTGIQPMFHLPFHATSLYIWSLSPRVLEGFLFRQQQWRERWMFWLR